MVVELLECFKQKSESTYGWLIGYDEMLYKQNVLLFYIFIYLVIK